MPLEDITDLLSFCLNTTQFVFEGTYYKQVFGTAMGSPVSAVIANLVMEDIEHRALTTALVSPSFWKRFVDDVISAVSQDEIVVLLQHLNSIEPSIQFTVERETDGKLPFLDILKENNYPKSFLYDCLRRPTLTDCNSPEGDSAVKGFAIVPYIQGIAEPIRRVLNNCGIKVALKPFQTLGHISAKPKDRVPTDQKTHAVYSIPCGDCEKVYLGQTKRQFCTRLKEHQRAVSNFNSSKSALAEHVCETSHNIAWEDSRNITTNNRYGQRLCLEAWHINASPCALNRDDGSHLPQEYLHLVGR